MIRILATTAMVFFLGAGACTSGNGGRPPPNAMKFSKLALSLEHRGFDPILEAEFDGLSWQVRAMRDGKPVALTVNPTVGHLGDVRPFRFEGDGPPPLPPRDGPSLWKIAQQVEEAGYAPILEVEFEDGTWEIEAMAPVEIEVDPISGKVLEMEVED